MRIAFAGNPNSGKTTMYNALTGRNEKVGNWAGVTVDRKEAPIKKVYAGDLELIAIEGKTVKVTLKGACGCCPHAQQTLKEGVEQVLRSEVDPEIVVERV